MTTVQFIYMIGVLWLIFSGVAYQPDAKGNDNLLCGGVFLLGLAHIILAATIYILGILFN